MNLITQCGLRGLVWALGLGLILYGRIWCPLVPPYICLELYPASTFDDIVADERLLSGPQQMHAFPPAKCHGKSSML